jgi:hypothetical protein
VRNGSACRRAATPWLELHQRQLVGVGLKPQEDLDLEYEPELGNLMKGFLGVSSQQSELAMEMRRS